MVMRDTGMANKNQSSGDSNNAEECWSISSSPLAGCSTRPYQNHSQGGDKVSSKVNNSHQQKETQVGTTNNCIYIQVGNYL